MGQNSNTNTPEPTLPVLVPGNIRTFSTGTMLFELPKEEKARKRTLEALRGLFETRESDRDYVVLMAGLAGNTSDKDLADICKCCPDPGLRLYIGAVGTQFLRAADRGIPQVYLDVFDPDLAEMLTPESKRDTTASGKKQHASCATFLSVIFREIHSNPHTDVSKLHMKRIVSLSDKIDMKRLPSICSPELVSSIAASFQFDRTVRSLSRAKTKVERFPEDIRAARQLAEDINAHLNKLMPATTDWEVIGKLAGPFAELLTRDPAWGMNQIFGYDTSGRKIRETSQMTNQLFDQTMHSSGDISIEALVPDVPSVWNAGMGLVLSGMHTQLTTRHIGLKQEPCFMEFNKRLKGLVETLPPREARQFLAGALSPGLEPMTNFFIADHIVRAASASKIPLSATLELLTPFVESEIDQDYYRIDEGAYNAGTGYLSVRSTPGKYNNFSPSCSSHVYNLMIRAVTDPAGIKPYLDRELVRMESQYRADLHATPCLLHPRPVIDQKFNYDFDFINVFPLEDHPLYDRIPAELVEQVIKAGFFDQNSNYAAVGLLCSRNPHVDTALTSITKDLEYVEPGRVFEQAGTFLGVRILYKLNRQLADVGFTQFSPFSQLGDSSSHSREKREGFDSNVSLTKQKMAARKKLGILTKVILGEHEEVIEHLHYAGPDKSGVTALRSSMLKVDSRLIGALRRVTPEIKQCLRVTLTQDLSFVARSCRKRNQAQHDQKWGRSR